MSRWIKIPADKIHKLPKYPGVYVLYYQNELIYIGNGDNLREKLKWHADQGVLTKGDPADFYVKFKICYRPEQWLGLGYRLISKLEPKWNHRTALSTTSRLTLIRREREGGYQLDPLDPLWSRTKRAKKEKSGDLLKLGAWLKKKGYQPTKKAA